jgi:pimeloyl-ACP methyl ester carboxylesterase
MPPETRYARSGGVHIAYQVLGEGPFDLVHVSGWVSNLEHAWQEPSYARFLNRLASFSRVIRFDKRGTGLSDPVPESALPTLEQRMDDVRAVMDAVNSERAALIGYSEGGPMCALFAATYPNRTLALIMYGAYARRMRDVDYPWGGTEEDHQAFLDEIERSWGGPVGLAARAPSVARDERFRHWWASYLRASASPQAVSALVRMNARVDIRQVLPSIRVPTLIIHRHGDLAIKVEHARYLAKMIPGARLVELPGVDHLPWVGDQDAILAEIEEFLTGVRPSPELNRVLATLMFTDIVGSTEWAARLGDRAWHDLLERHHALVRGEIDRFRGREVDTAGDGFFATFDGPARAVRCALNVRDAMRHLGIEIRAGLHTGEIDLTGEKAAGIAVHTAARVLATARAGEVLASRTVKDLVAGSGIRFTDRGAHVLKGVPSEWPLFAVS